MPICWPPRWATVRVSSKLAAALKEHDRRGVSE